MQVRPRHRRAGMQPLHYAEQLQLNIRRHSPNARAPRSGSRFRSGFRRSPWTCAGGDLGHDAAYLPGRTAMAYLVGEPRFPHFSAAISPPIRRIPRSCVDCGCSADICCLAFTYQSAMELDSPAWCRRIASCGEIGRASDQTTERWERSWFTEIAGTSPNQDTSRPTMT